MAKQLYFRLSHGFVEVYNAYPVKDALKASGFKWDPSGMDWYAPITPDTVRLVVDLGAKLDFLQITKSKTPICCIPLSAEYRERCKIIESLPPRRGEAHRWREYEAPCYEVTSNVSIVRVLSCWFPTDRIADWVRPPYTMAIMPVEAYESFEAMRSSVCPLIKGEALEWPK